MPPFARKLLAFIVFVSAYFFVYWSGYAVLPASVADAFRLFLALAIAAAAAFLAWRGMAPDSRGLASNVLTGALLLGGAGMFAGFFGPMLLGGGNQGPLLGLLITGPAGLVLGAIGGGIYWFRNREREAQE